jgi:prolyl-tRNA synthetase
MSVRRDNRAKESIPLEVLADRLPALLDEVQRALFESARAFREENTGTAHTLAELEAHFVTKRGFVAVPWDGSAAFEAEVKEKTGATMRCIPLDQTPWQGLARAGQDVALFARAY